MTASLSVCMMQRCLDVWMYGCMDVWMYLQMCMCMCTRGRRALTCIQVEFETICKIGKTSQCSLYSSNLVLSIPSTVHMQRGHSADVQKSNEETQ